MPKKRNRVFLNAGAIGYGKLIRDSDGNCIAVMYSGDINPHAAADAKLFIASGALLSAAIIAERFMRGFEGDEMQPGIDEKLAQIRDAIEQAGAEVR